LRAFYILLLETNSESVDARKGFDSVLKTMVHHSDERNFVLKYFAHCLVPSLTLIAETASV